jgi:hypothetical protein
MTKMRYAPRQKNHIYLDRFDTPRLKSSLTNQELAITTLKFHALFPVRVPVLSQTQIFDGLLPLLATEGKENAEEFKSLMGLVDKGNIAMSLFDGTDSLAKALDKALSKGIDKNGGDYGNFFEFAGFPFLQANEPQIKVESREEFKNSLSEGKGRTGDDIANRVIDMVIELDKKLINHTNDSRRYVKAGTANTQLPAHIETYLLQNKHTNEKLPKQLATIFAKAKAEGQQTNRSYYYQFEIDGLRTAIDLFYNVVLAESITGSSISSPYTCPTVDEEYEQTLNIFMDVLFDFRRKKDYDARRRESTDKGSKAIISSEIKWADILRWEEALTKENKKLCLPGDNDHDTYIKTKIKFLCEYFKEYEEKINWFEIGGSFLCAMSGAFNFGGVLAKEPSTVLIAVSAASLLGSTLLSINAIKNLPDCNNINKLEKFYKAYRIME